MTLSVRLHFFLLDGCAMEANLEVPAIGYSFGVQVDTYSGFELYIFCMGLNYPVFYTY